MVVNDVPGGGRMKERTTGAERGANITYAAPKERATRDATPAAGQPNRRRRRAGTWIPACVSVPAIHFSCSFTSCAVWKRSSGFFSRHVFTTWSSAGGDVG